MSIVKEILNDLYLLSGPVIAVISIFALRQIAVAKDQLRMAKKSIEITSKSVEITSKSIEINSRRESAVFTAKQCDNFASRIIPSYGIILRKFNEKDIPVFKFPNDDSIISNIDYSPWLANNIDKIYENDQELFSDIATLLNSLEAFSIYFTHRICDVNIAYLPIANTYINIIEELSPMICFHRGRNNKYFCNILQLYDLWKDRQTKEGLEIKQKEYYKQFIDAKEKASCIIDKNYKPIGLDE